MFQGTTTLIRICTTASKPNGKKDDPTVPSETQLISRVVCNLFQIVPCYIFSILFYIFKKYTQVFPSLQLYNLWGKIEQISEMIEWAMITSNKQSRKDKTHSYDCWESKQALVTTRKFQSRHREKKIMARRTPFFESLKIVRKHKRRICQYWPRLS